MGCFPISRANAEFSMYGDTKEARSNVLEMLKMSIEENPLFRDKLQLPNIENSRLQRLINQRYLLFSLTIEEI